jgi:hypothetical protein
VVVGINPAESMHGALLNAAAIDLPRLKTMFVIGSLLTPLCSHVTLSTHLFAHTSHSPHTFSFTRAPQVRSPHECAEAGQDSSNWQRLQWRYRRSRGGASACHRICRRHLGLCR